MSNKWRCVTIGVVIMAGLASALFFWLRPDSGTPEEGKLQPLITDDKVLAANLAQICEQYQQPAMACALVNGHGLITRASSGSAVYGKEAPVGIDSRFHIGSTTKSMTALLIQMLVDEGKLSYATTLEKALPAIAMRPEYRQLTLDDLLLNRAGIIAFQRMDLEDPAVFAQMWTEIPARYPAPRDQRREVARLALNLNPIGEPGRQAVYSNVGWSIAGLIAETAAGQPYEELLKTRIFEPLGMKKARTGGWPANPLDPAQPRGHYSTPGKSPEPQDLKDAYVFPDWMNPSGGVHCTITDYALYVLENLAGLEGQGRLLSQNSYANIHAIHLTAKISEMYMGMTQEGDLTLGYGWGVFPIPGGNLSVADGSGGTFLARLAVYPALDVAFAGFTNCGDGSAALDEAIKRLTGLDIKL
jgi:CubicO group peptidase (beta-lactamase class C family)